MKNKSHIKWSSAKWDEEIEYAKIILNKDERIPVRMLNIRYSMESILKYLCKDNNITYRIANDAIQDLHKRNVLNIQDVQAFHDARVFSNKYCHYGQQQSDNDDIDMSEADLNLAVQAWKYIAIWIAGRYFADVSDDNKKAFLDILQESSHSSEDADDTSSTHDDSIAEEEKANHPTNQKEEPLENSDVVMNEETASETETTDNNFIVMPNPEELKKDMPEDNTSDDPNINEPLNASPKPLPSPKPFYKRYSIIFLIIVALLLFAGRFCYTSGYLDTMKPAQMIQAETDIHGKMWILTNGINGDVRSERNIHNAQNWIDESDRLLSDIDNEIQRAEDARIHDTDLKAKYLDILQHEKESVTHTRQGIVDTTQGKSYSEEFLKGTQVDMQYDQLHEAFVKSYSK